MRKVTLYTRAGCHLCEAAEEWIRQAHAQAGFALEVLDIDEDEALRERYHESVPVVAVDGHDLFWGRIDQRALLERLKR
jgi:glutaredoxin